MGTARAIQRTNALVIARGDDGRWRRIEAMALESRMTVGVDNQRLFPVLVSAATYFSDLLKPAVEVLQAELGERPPKVDGGWNEAFVLQRRLIAGPDGSFIDVGAMCAAESGVTAEAYVFPLEFRDEFAAIRKRAGELRDVGHLPHAEKRAREDALAHDQQQLLGDLWSALPFGAVVTHEKALAEDETEIAVALAAAGAPLAADGRYRVTELDGSHDGERQAGQRHYLIEYTRPVETQGVAERLLVAKRHIPNAFRKPLATSRAPAAFVSGTAPAFELGPDSVRPPSDFLEREWAPDDGAAGKRARSLVAKKGTDALGWYSSPHAFDDRSWGIYLDDKLIGALALEAHHDLSRQGRSLPRHVLLWALSAFVYEHEWFHARLDQLALELEIAAGHATYNKYVTRAFRPGLRTEGGALEEALAEHAAHIAMERRFAALASARWITPAETAALREWLHQLSASAPPGYRHYAIGADPMSARRLLAQVAQRTHEPLTPFAHNEYLLQRSDAWDRHGVPVFVRRDGPLADSLLRPEKRRDMIRMLRDAGFEEKTDRGKGSHTFWVHPDGRRHTLPGHREISPGVAREVFELISMTYPAWAEARRRGRFRDR